MIHNKMEEILVNIYVAIHEKCMTFKCNESDTIEDVCTLVCKQLNIRPLTRCLFALQDHDSKIFLEDCMHIEKITEFDLRIRYKIPNLSRLRQLDSCAYKYYFHQARKDVLENKVPEILYSKHSSELLGLGITDMYRVMVEEKKSQQDIMKEYKKYVPKEVTKKHAFFTKKPIYNNLENLQKRDLSSCFVIEQYMSHLDSLAPNYLSEEYNVTLDRNHTLYDAILYIMPFHKEHPGLRYSLNKGKEWEQLCSIDEICFVTIREDATLELSRKNGIPVYLKFKSVSHMRSFVSVCDGYYRLMIKWTFNICKDMPSPLLLRLHSIKSHGPVGGEFSYQKLEEKRLNKPGSYILRQCENQYDAYYIDVYSKHSLKPITHKIEQVNNGFIFNGAEFPVYKSIPEIINAHKNPENEIFLQDCLPPSEYDKSQVLLCAPYEPIFTSNVNHDDLEKFLIANKGPRCIDSKDLQLYKGTRIEGSEKVSCFFKARWNLAQGKKMDVAMKMLKQDTSEIYLKEFINHAGQWAFLKCSAIVRLYGITLRSPVAMVMELTYYGPLDAYLRNRCKTMQTVDLVEAAASLATALWHLDENGIVHGNIRCRKLLVAEHDSSKFTVKLSDQGLHSGYKDSEIHWIPIEYHNNLEQARKSTSTDVWAFATTLWEIFSYGTSPSNTSQAPTRKNYSNGIRLTIPINCPEGIYTIMRDCWLADPHIRSRSQVIMRDVNKLWYQVFNSRRTHSYETLFSNPIHSNLLTGEAHFLAASEAEDDTYNWSSKQTSFTYDDYLSNDAEWNVDQNIYEFDGYNVVLQGLIGEGFYGYVFKGTLQKEEGCQSKELRTVAVKKLKSNIDTSQLDDFDQEIKIVKNLKHDNIVEILGIVEKPDILLIMEYIPHGSLASYLKIYRFGITKNQLLKYALDVAEGMEYLETMHIVHRDLAARNILVVSENHVKITDFGLAREIDNGGYYLFKSSRALPLNWYAPESKTHGKFSTKSDVWSYGVTLWEMFTFGLLEPPQWDPNAAEERFPSGLYCPDSCPSVVYTTLITPCWEFVPSQRPTFTQIAIDCRRLQQQF